MSNSLLEQYQRQWHWRDWDSLYKMLPDLKASTVFDLGCAHGDHSEKLSRLGAKVIGLDGNQELLDFANQRELPNTSFICCNLNEIETMNLEAADGVWLSFVAAYFTNFKIQLKKISTLLKPGAWIAITEMDHLFGQLPVADKYKDEIQSFYDHMLLNAFYDFRSGSKLKECLIEAGFEIQIETVIGDSELSKQGPCSDEVVDAWKHRLARMKGFQQFLGNKFNDFETDFLSCLKNEKHTSVCKVNFMLATLSITQP